MSDAYVSVNCPENLTDDPFHTPVSRQALHLGSKSRLLVEGIPSFLRWTPSAYQPRSVSNSSTRALSEGCNTYPACPPGTPYNKRNRPALYMPAPRTTCTLAIPENLSATLLDAVSRAEERLNTLPFEEAPREVFLCPEGGEQEWDYDESTISDFFEDETLITSTPKHVRTYKLEHGCFPDGEDKELTACDLTWAAALLKERLMDQDLGDTTAVRPAELCCPLHDPLATPHSLELLSDVSDISLASLNSHLWRSRDLCDVSSDEEDLEDDNASPVIEEDGDALESGLTSSHLDDCVVHLVSLAQRWLIRDTPMTAPLPSTAVSQCLSFLNFDDSPNVVDVAPLSFPAETHILPVLHLALPHHASPENLINLGLAGERGKCSDELSPILFVGLSGLDSDQSSNASNFCAESAVGFAAAVSPPPVSLSQLLIPSVSSEVPSALDLGFLAACDAQDNHEVDLDSHEVVALGLGALELDTPDLGSLDPDASDLYMLDWNSIDLDTLELVSLPIGCSASSIFFAADSPDPSSGSLRLLITEDSTGFVLSASSSFDAQSISGDRLAGEDGDDVEEERARRWEQIRTGAACVALVGSVVLLSAVGFVMV